MKFNEIKDFNLNYAQKTQIVSNDLLELQLNENIFRNMNASFDQQPKIQEVDDKIDFTKKELSTQPDDRIVMF